MALRLFFVGTHRRQQVQVFRARHPVELYWPAAPKSGFPFHDKPPSEYFVAKLPDQLVAGPVNRLDDSYRAIQVADANDYLIQHYLVKSL